MRGQFCDSGSPNPTTTRPMRLMANTASVGTSTGKSSSFAFNAIDVE
jgi:hypothetical protein